jgi:hypothetical protein
MSPNTKSKNKKTTSAPAINVPMTDAKRALKNSFIGVFREKLV